MSNDRSGKSMGQTAKSYCEQWLKEQIYQRKNEFSSKYTQKGNEVEDNALDFIAEHLGLGMLFKNEKHFNNDFITGTPDAILNDCIIDNKSSWDCFTFPLFDTELPNKDYYWQGQGYMDLVGVDNYKVIYTLINTPHHLIEKEAFYFCKNNGYEDLDIDVLDQFTDKMTFDNIDPKYKIKVFEFGKNQSDIEKIYERVEECRNYIKSIEL
jgi:hypothetical protein